MWTPAFLFLVFTAVILDDSGSGVDGEAKSPRMQQRKLQRSPKVRRARPQPSDEEQGLESSGDSSGRGSVGRKAQSSRKRPMDCREKLSSSRKTQKNGKVSVASGAAEAAGTPGHESRNGIEGMPSCHLQDRVT